MPVLLGDKSATPYLGSTAIPKVYVGSDVVLGGGVVPPVLNTLTVSPSSATVGQAYTGTVSGRSVGSQLTLSGAGAAGLTINSATGAITGTPTASGAVNVVETLAGATGSPKTSPGVVTVAAVPAIPFTYDASTYWWDFAAADNEVDNLGTATVSRVREKVSDKATIRNYNKAWQPLKVTGGVSFNQATNRFLNFSLPPTITNGKNGWYLAFVLTPTTSTNGVVMSISGPASTVNSRMFVDFTGSRNIRLRFGAADSTTLSTLFTSAALTLGQKYAIEILFDFDADTYTLWINGVNQNVTVTGGPWSNFAASNPREVLVGNFTSGALSLDAVLNNIVFQDGVPTSDIRSSVSAFQQTRQAA